MERPLRIGIIGTGRDESSVGWQLAYKVCELIDEFNILEEYKNQHFSGMHLDDFISKRDELGLSEIEPYEQIYEGEQPVRPNIIHLDFHNRTQKYAESLRNNCAEILKHPYSKQDLDEALRVRSIEEICNDYTSNDIVFVSIDASNYREQCKQGKPPKPRQKCLEPNKGPIIKLAEDFKKHKYCGKVVIVTNPTDIFAYLFAAYSGMHPERIIGFAPETERYLRIVRGIFEDGQLIEWFLNSLTYVKEHIEQKDWDDKLIEQLKSIESIKLSNEYSNNRKSIFTKKEIPPSVIEGLIFGEHGPRICAIESHTRIQGYPAIPNIFKTVFDAIGLLGEYILKQNENAIAGAENNLRQIDKQIGPVLTACALNRFDKEGTTAYELAPVMKKMILSIYRKERFCASTFLRFSQVKAGEESSYYLPEYLSLVSSKADDGEGDPGIYTGYLVEPTLFGFRAVEDYEISLVPKEFAEFLEKFRQIYNADFKTLHQNGVHMLEEMQQKNKKFTG